MIEQTFRDAMAIVTEINLTPEGEKLAARLREFEEINMTLAYYTKPPTVNVDGEHWTLGNDALLILSGDLDDKQTVATSQAPEDLFAAFVGRIVTYFDEIGLDFPISDLTDTPEGLLAEVWTDFLHLGLVSWEDVDEGMLISVPEL